jgi:hypothetical protein
MTNLQQNMPKYSLYCYCVSFVYVIPNSSPNISCLYISQYFVNLINVHRYQWEAHSSEDGFSTSSTSGTAWYSHSANLINQP